MGSVQERRIIEEGSHNPKKKHRPIFVHLKKFFTIEMNVRFSTECLYKFNSADDNDRNKLFGLSFTLFPRIRHEDWSEGHDIRIWFKVGKFIVIRPQHWNSVRFVWNISSDGKHVLLSPYIFKDGRRMFKHHFSDSKGTTLNFEVGTFYRLLLNVRKETNEVRLAIYDGHESSIYLDFDKVSMKLSKWRVVYYYLDLYFGRARSAPHTMFLDEQRTVD